MNPRLLLPLALLLPTAACGEDTPAGTPPATPAPAAATGTPLSGDRYSLTLPAGWRPVDPTSDTSPAVAGSFGLTGPNAELLKELLADQVKAGVKFAIDPATARGSTATHLTAGCESGGLTGSTLDDLKRKAKALDKTATVTDLTVGGRPAIKIVGSRPGTETITVRVPTAKDRYCYLDLGGPTGLASTADPILATFTVT